MKTVRVSPPRQKILGVSVIGAYDRFRNTSLWACFKTVASLGVCVFVVVDDLSSSVSQSSYFGRFGMKLLRNPVFLIRNQ